MISTEERLRAAARAAADTVAPGSAPPLRLPPGAPDARLRGGWFRHRGRLATFTPLAAAAAVIIVLAVAVAVAVAHGQPGHRAAARPGSLLAQLPPYYVVLHGDAPVGSAKSAQVRATATGKVLATVRPPRPDTVFMPQVSAAGDGHEFVLLASRWKSKKLKAGLRGWFTASKLLLLRFDPYTHRPLLTALPIPPGVIRDQTGFALSRSGQQLAVARALSKGRASPEIQVFSLMTGAVKTWTWPGGGPVTSRVPIPGVGQVLSWAADGTLAFQQQPGSGAQVRLLDTNGPGGSLQADSRLVLDWAGDAGPNLRYRPNQLTGMNVLLTPDASRIVCATVTVTRHPLTSVLAFTEYSARTGRLVRQLGSWTLHGLWPGDDQDALWTNASGSTLIVVAHPPGLKHVGVNAGNVARWSQVISVLTPSAFIRLPGAPSAESPSRWPAW